MLMPDLPVLIGESAGAGAGLPAVGAVVLLVMIVWVLLVVKSGRRRR